MSQSKRPTRRDFLKTSGAAFGVPYIITSAALGNSERPAASDRIVMGGIGIGNMGRGDQRAFLDRKDVQYVAMSGRTTIFVNCWPGPISTRCILPRPIIGMRSSQSKLAAMARMFSAKNRKHSPCGKVR